MALNPIAYSGDWYELGKYPKVYENKCNTATTTYKYIPSSKTIDVTNFCWAYQNGHLVVISSIHGVATPTNDPNSFRLKFDTVPAEASYDILWTDYENFSFVGKHGGPILGYYWILGRRPTLTDAEKAFLHNKTIELGFDPKKVIMNNNTGFVNA
jgi:apolipoprotein D and lipocalin family protein